jgi:hypothetical protein
VLHGVVVSGYGAHLLGHPDVNLEQVVGDQVQEVVSMSIVPCNLGCVLVIHTKKI